MLIENITRVQGVRDNQLMGYGLVVGLAGTGDSNRNQATIQSISNMLGDFGVQVTNDQVLSKNIAAVIVTAQLPSFSNNGDTIDVHVSSLGDASSLQGGTLLMTPLKAANNQIYAIAQGNISLGGFNAQGGGSQVNQNHPTVGRIPNGALIEREINPTFNRNEIIFLLNDPNFETANRIKSIINDYFQTSLSTEQKIAKAIDAGRVEVKVPRAYSDDVIDFIAKIQGLEVQVSSQARVVINERTGTVVMGHGVRISTVSIAHGNLTVTISSNAEVSQPESFSEGDTVVSEETVIDVEEEDGALNIVSSGTTIEDLVNGLNAIGATPRDIIAILQEMKTAGALHAELILN
ncbi:MAG: flagellar basal body P-ring protein FlgI [bacterium]